MSNIFITGATGFVGTNLTRNLLRTGNNIHILIKKNSNLWRIKDILPKLHVIKTSLHDTKNLKKILKKQDPDYIFHLATYGGYPFQQDIQKIVKTNIISSLNLFDSLDSCSNLKRVINIGSSSEYGPKSKPMKETDFVVPVTPYGITKLTQTLFSQYFFRERNIPIVTLRLFSVFGPYEEPGRLWTDLMLSIINHTSLELYSPNPKRDFIFIDDVISAIQKAAVAKKAEGQIFNIGGGKEYTVGEIVEKSIKITKSDISLKWGSEDKKRKFDTTVRWIANINKSKKMLKWEPSHSLEDGILKTYKWYKKNSYLYRGKK